MMTDPSPKLTEQEGRGPRYRYFPGCTLSTTAKHLDAATRRTAGMLGIVLEEIPDWTCCGATYPLATDSLMGLLPPARMLCPEDNPDNLPLMTICSVCFNVLRRTNAVLRDDADKRERLTAFIEREYREGTRVLHYLEILRGGDLFAGLAARVTNPLANLRAAPYYGCLLLRPAPEMAFDDPERPVIFQQFLSALGCDTVPFPLMTECCGSYQSVGVAPEVAAECGRRIAGSARGQGAELLVTTCPLCHFNLERAPSPGAPPIPVIYFTQLLGVALGLAPAEVGIPPESPLAEVLAAKGAPAR